MSAFTPQDFESLIIEGLFKNVDIREKILPYIRLDVFDSEENRNILKELLDYQEKYSKFPSASEIKLMTSEEEFKHFSDIMNNNLMGQFESQEFLYDEIETFFKKKLIFNEILDAHASLNSETIPLLSEKFREIESFTFDNKVGLDLFSSPDTMFELMHSDDSVVATGLNNIDGLIRGGLHTKSLTLFVGQSNIGKSLVKCAISSNLIRQNKNVLYVTLELSEGKVGERILANLFDVQIDELYRMNKKTLGQYYSNMTKQIKGKFIIKEYPARTFNANRLRSLIKELNTKKNFVPDVIFIDYIGIMTTNKNMKGANTNTELKVISEEVRGVSMEFGMPIVSSSQANRGAYGSSDVDMEDIADSIGQVMTADIIFTVSQTEEMEQAGRYKFKLVKNRYGVNMRNTYLSVDKAKMKLTDVEFDEFSNASIDVQNAAALFNPNTIKNKSSTALNQQKNNIQEDLDDIKNITKLNKKTQQSKITGINLDD